MNIILMTLKSDLEVIKSKLPLRYGDPIDIIDEAVMESPFKLREFIEFPTDRIVGYGTTGLADEGKIGQSIGEVETYLSEINFGPDIKELYDCEDRAFWGMAHIRRHYRGFPVGVISGVMSGKKHAIIVTCHKVGDRWIQNYYDPGVGKGNGRSIKLPPNRTTPCDNDKPKSIISFPIADKNKPQEPPFDRVERLNGLLIYDKKWLIYRSSDIFDYLEHKGWEECSENHTIFNLADGWDYFVDYDRPLEIYAHVRRAFPGAPIGVAIGKHINGISDSVNILWHHENDRPSENKIVYSYWDPDPRLNQHVVKFIPEMIFV